MFFRKLFRRTLAIVICAAMVFTFMPSVGLLDAQEVHAADPELVKEGDYWKVTKLNGEYTLTIGDGSDNQTIEDVAFYGSVLGDYHNQIKRIQFSGNVNITGTAVFSNMTALEEFNATGLRLGDGATASFPFFDGCTNLKSLDLRGTGLFDNWADFDGGLGQPFFQGCTNLESLRFDFDEDNCTKNFGSMSFIGTFWDCPNLKSADLARLIVHGAKHRCVDFTGMVDDWYSPLGDNTGKVALGIYDEYPSFYSEKRADMTQAVEAFNNELSGMQGKGYWDGGGSIIASYEALENIIKNFITLDEYNKLLELKNEAETILNQNPFPYSDAVKTELQDVVSLTEDLDENSTKTDAQGIIDKYNNAMDLIAAEAVKNLFNALPAEDDVKASDEAQIEAARAAYEALTDSQKALIETDVLQKLTDAETGLSELKRLLTDLQELITEAKALDTSIYTDASLAPFTQALSAAELLLTGDPTKGEVDAARVALEDAIGNLKTKEAQNLEDAKAALGTLIDNAEKLDSDLLTDESKADLEKAINDAKEVYNKDDATKDEIDKAIADLTDVLNNLNSLDDYREAAENELRNYKNHDDYSDTGKAALNDIINAAIAEINTKTSEAEIDAIVNKAKADMDAVKTKAQELEDAKNALRDSISDAEDKLLDKDKYTEDSVNDLKDALDKAKNTVDDSTATKDQIDQAKKDLDDAIAGLKDKESGGSGTDPGTGGNTGSGTDPGTGGNTGSGTDPGTGGNTGSGTDPGTGGNTGSGTDPGTGGNNTGTNTGNTGNNGNDGNNSGDNNNGNTTNIINYYTITNIKEIEKYIPVEIAPSTPAPQAAVESLILKTTGEDDIKGSTYAPLKFHSKKQKKNSITLQWTKVKGAKKYVIYGSACGKKMVKIATLSKGKKAYTVKKIDGKKLKKGTYYKFTIVALKGDKTLAASKSIHVSTVGSKKKANYIGVSIPKKVVTKAKKLKKGKTLALKAKGTLKTGMKAKNHIKKILRYESSNKKIATVSKTGKIKGKKKGACYIYVYTQSGIAKKIKVTVK